MLLCGFCLRLVCGRGRRRCRGPVGFVDGEAVQGAVELAVAAAVEAVAVGVARGGGDRRAAGGARELGVGREAVGAGDLADELGGGQGAAAALGEQLRRVAFDERGELCLELVDARGELADAATSSSRRSSREWSAVRGRAGGEAFPSQLAVSARRPGSRARARGRADASAALLISRVRVATRRSRWSTSRRMSSSAPASCATGSSSRPSLIAARATRPRRSSRTCRARAMSGARRPSASARRARPARRGRAGTARARRTRAGSPRSPTPARGRALRAQRNSFPKLPALARHRQLAARGAVSASTAAAGVRALVRVRPDHDHLQPSLRLWLTKRTPADTSQSGLVPSSYQVTPVVLGRRRATQHPVGQTTWSTESQ